MVGALSVNTAGNNEQGLVGLTFDPKFGENGWIYLYYFHPKEKKAVFSRWEVRNDALLANSEKVMLEWEAKRETCCHTGGGMTWDRDGNLIMTVGNNRGNNGSAQTDERPGRAAWDDQGGTANSNSLEGKILRIHPEPDGTYTIPKGNLFPPGTPKTRPEIFSMGHRNVWRVSMDSRTGFLYWGEVGPDNREDSEIGPRGYDEFNQARGPGFFGWPYFVADQAFPFWDDATGKPLAKKDPLKPTNFSPNNTGINELPPMSPPYRFRFSLMETINRWSASFRITIRWNPLTSSLDPMAISMCLNMAVDGSKPVRMPNWFGSNLKVATVGLWPWLPPTNKVEFRRLR